jgi:hypothetical protein
MPRGHQSSTPICCDDAPGNPIGIGTTQLTISTNTPSKPVQLVTLCHNGESRGNMSYASCELIR